MMTDITDTFKEKLIEIRQLIATGWCQGVYCQVTNEIPEYCLAGAIDRATERSTALTDSIRRYLRLRLRDNSLMDWNDADGRTKEEVLTFLDEAIANAN